MDLYAQNILEHFRNPVAKSQLPIANCSHEHTEKNPSCGDELTIGIKENNTVQWDGTGCAISIAAMSMLAEAINDGDISNLETITAQNMYDMLGVPIGTRRVKCALLGLHCLQNALKDGEQTWGETIGA